MKQVNVFRKGAVIRVVERSEDGKIISHSDTDYKSISKARHASRTEHGLGNVQNVDKFPSEEA